jgi:hypothetical protein
VGFHRGTRKESRSRRPFGRKPWLSPFEEGIVAGELPTRSATAGTHMSLSNARTDGFLKAALLLFWALWFSLVSATNIADALRAGGVLPAGWTYASGNFGFLRSVTGPHGVPAALAVLLFGGVIAWEVLAAGMHWRAFVSYKRSPADAHEAVGSAFSVSVLLWCAFMIADEIFVSYEVEGAHVRFMIAELATLLFIRLVPTGTDRTQ